MNLQPSKLGDKARNAAAVVVCGLLTAGPVLAQTADTPEAAMGEAKTQILALIAVAGAAMIAVALAGVGWNVGSRLIKRIGGKA